MLNFIKHTLAFAALLISLCMITLHNRAHAAELPEDKSKAVILAYHRIGEDAYPDTNIRLAQFIEHIHELEHGDYNILPIPEILDAIQTNTPLPPKTIGITFEGAYMSAWYNAMPILMDKNIPFTVFYASDKADQKQTGHIDWKTLKKLAVHKHVTLAALPASYSHIAHTDKTTMTAALNKARARFRENFAYEVDYLAYPFGEYNNVLTALAKAQGFKAAFALHSGPIHSSTDLYAIPRFSMTEGFADLERLRMITNTLPLPTTDIEPQNPDITAQPLNIGFTLPEALTSKADALSCFLSGHGKVDTQILENRIEIRPDPSTNNDTKLRLNCTIAESTKSNETPQWRWLSMLFHRKQPLTAPNPEPDAPQAPLE
jgi:peptidoglycan/xylan/chitin deacetylase (PgdA/CDA1 family)